MNLWSRKDVAQFARTRKDGRPQGLVDATSVLQRICGRDCETTMTDDITLPPLPEPQTLVIDADVGSRAYTPRQMRSFARAAVLADREGREPVAWMHVMQKYQEASDRQLDDSERANGWTQFPLYAAPPRDAEAIMQAVNDLIEEEIELMLIIGLPRSKQEGITAKRDAARARLEALVRGK